ncbi:elongation factor P hydroxylase [Paraglaciecola aestuariivivens]
MNQSSEHHLSLKVGLQARQPVPDLTHHYQDLIALFNGAFALSYQTKLVKGTDEPIYLPANAQCDFHQVVFAHGYYASALHEIAHWCIAGDARRLLEDYGYWYCPDGRDESEQAEFEKVETKPQALEWAFSVAAGAPFRVSTDNLNGAEVDRQAFALKVKEQVEDYFNRGFPPRAEIFIRVLQNFYHTPPLELGMFNVK